MSGKKRSIDRLIAMGAAAARYGTRDLPPARIGELLSRAMELGSRLSLVLYEQRQAAQASPGTPPTGADEAREDEAQKLERMISGHLEELGARSIHFRRDCGARSVEFDFRPVTSPQTYQYPFFLGDGAAVQELQNEQARKRRIIVR